MRLIQPAFKAAGRHWANGVGPPHDTRQVAGSRYPCKNSRSYPVMIPIRYLPEQYAVPHCRNSAISSSAFSYIAILFPFLSVILRAPSSPSYPKRQKSETSASLFSLIQFTAYTVRSWPCSASSSARFSSLSGAAKEGIGCVLSFLYTRPIKSVDAQQLAGNGCLHLEEIKQLPQGIRVDLRQNDGLIQLSSPG